MRLVSPRGARTRPYETKSVKNTYKGQKKTPFRAFKESRAFKILVVIGIENPYTLHAQQARYRLRYTLAHAS